jgi:RecA-family ATPase
MAKKTIQQITDDMSPETALKEIAMAAKKLLSLLDEKARLEFVMNVIGDSGTDKVTSLVHL